MTVADPLRLSRRDRAALTLALECLRAFGAHLGDRDAWECLEDAQGVLLIAERLCPADSVSRRVERAIEGHAPRNRRLLRARLALLLRAVLRADAYARDAATLGLPAAILMRWPPVCDGCGEGLINYAIGDRVNVCPKREGHPVARQARPLWESAPTRATSGRRG